MPEPASTTTDQQQKAPLKRRLWWLIRILVVVVIVLVLALPVGMGSISMIGLLRPGCGGDFDTPAKYGLAYQPIQIPSRLGGVYRGYFIPGVKTSTRRDSATIIFTAAYNGGPGKMLYEAVPLVEQGYNAVLYESRACVGRTINLGYRDIEDIEDVIGYLRNNSDGIQVNMERLALHGFSEGGAAALMAAGKLNTVRAVLAEGGFHNMNEYIGIDKASNALETLMLLGMTATYRLLTGDDPAVLNPAEAAKQIPPRALFLVYGSKEISLPGARKTLANVLAVNPRTMAQLWVVPGADHGGYTQAAGIPEYVRQTSAFYDCALLDDCTMWNTIWKR